MPARKYLNDVTALRRDVRLAEVARRRRMPLILMHMHGEPRTMQTKPFARNVLREVHRGLRRAVAAAQRAGVPKQQIVLDPGIGFGKNDRQNYELLAGLPELARLGFPLIDRHFEKRIYRTNARRGARGTNACGALRRPSPLAFSAEPTSSVFTTLRKWYK